MYASRKLYDCQYDQYRLTVTVPRCDTCPKDEYERLRIARLLAMRESSCPRCTFVASAVETAIGRTMNELDQLYAKFSDTRIYVSDDRTSSNNHFQICEPLDHRTEWRTSAFTELSLDTGGSDAVKWAKNRLTECLLEHAACSQGLSEHARPRRVLDLQFIKERGIVSLVQGLAAKGVDQYVCISYCWGAEQKMRLTTTTRQSLLDGVPLTGLSLNFQQLLPFLGKLGFRFVWIDALCIQQDSLEDKKTEISKMRSIYEGAVMTVALASSSGAGAGVFGKIAMESRSFPVECDDKESPFAGLSLRLDPGTAHLTQEAGHISGQAAYPLTLRAW